MIWIYIKRLQKILAKKNTFSYPPSLCFHSILLIFLMNTPLLFAQKIGDYIFFGKAELEKGNYTEAIKYFNDAINLRPASYEGYFLRGYSKYNLDDYRGAESDFTKASEFDPYNPEIYHYRALVRSDLYDFGGAMEDFSMAIEIDQKNPFYYLNRARTLLFLQKYDSAIADCNKAIELKYKKDNVYIMRGMAWAGLKDYDKAIEDLTLGIMKDTLNPWGYIQRGNVRMESKHSDSAIFDFNKALALDPGDTYALMSRALARMENADTTGALSDLDHLIKLSPYNSYAYYNRAILYIGLKREKEALSDLDKVISMNQDNIILYLYRGMLKEAIGDLKGAIEDFTKSIEIYPEFADAYYERSRVKRRMHDLRGAEEDSKIAYGINKFNFKENDSLQLEQKMYLKRLVAFSDEFHDDAGTSSKLQDQLVEIQLQPLFNVTMFSKDISVIRLFDTFEKSGYYNRVVVLNNKEYAGELDKVKAEVDSLSIIILKEPKRPEHYLKRAEYYSFVQNYNLALADYNKVVELDKNCILAFFGRANLQFRLSQLIRQEPENIYPLKAGIVQPETNHLTDTTLLGRPFENSLSDFTKAITTDPEFYFAWYNRGYVKFMNGDYWGAVSDFTRAIELNPDFPEAHFNKGIILIFLKLRSVGCIDLSRAGELGIQDAYHVMKRYCTK
jgi:tetratricopeptide (TPR) repeat protein